MPVVVSGSGHNGPRLQEAIALLDTGATSSGLCSAIVASLDLEPLGRRVIGTAAGSRRSTTYRFGMAFPPDSQAAGPRFLPFELNGIEFTESPMFQVLIGMDVISAGTLLVQPDRHWSLDFSR